MSLKNILKITCFLVFGFLFEANICAQTFATFPLKIGEEEYTVTKEIDPMFMGTYSVGAGEKQKQYSIGLEENSTFEWGAVVSGDELATTDVMEYAKGKMVSYTAYTICYNNTATGEKGELMLYELNGKKYLGQAEKIESVAENR